MPRKILTGETVLAAARRRISWLFDQVELGHIKQIICSISGGKDSTVLAHLALVEANRRNRRVGLFFLDEEAMYQSTIEQVEYMMQLYPENTTPLWLQVPFTLTNATSVSEAELQAWAPGESARWMRKKRNAPGTIKHKPWPEAGERFRSGCKRLDFYGVIQNFERCYDHTAWLVGLRAKGESLNRWRAVVDHPVTIGGQKVYWGSKRGSNWTLYPVFDWDVSDVWRYIHDEKLQYHKVYDHMHKKGVYPTQMRISSLIHERAFKSIADLPEFEPKTYERLLKRIKGIALAQETGKAAKMLKCTKLPKAHKTWTAYRNFLLATHLDQVRRPIFEARFAAQLQNEYVARQQCRQLVLNDYENNLPIDNKPDPWQVHRESLLAYYEGVM